MATHPWQIASGWHPKPTNWRQRYWHRPPSYAHGPGADNAPAYRAWLNEQGRDAGAVIKAQHEIIQNTKRGAVHNGPELAPVELPSIGKPAKPKLKRAPAPVPQPEPKVKPVADNIAPFPPAHEREPAPVHASEADRRQQAAELLRDIAAQYGPRRAHKLRAMADWLVAEPAVRIARQA
jgi:hypothetical protein